MVNEMAMQDDIPFGALLVVVLGCCAAVGYSLMSVRRMLVIQDHLIEAVGQMVQRQGVIEQMTGMLNLGPGKSLMMSDWHDLDSDGRRVPPPYSR